jgi:N-acetylneuraminic acid mutarotase
VRFGMIQIKASELWPELEKFFKNRTGNIMAAIAYISDDSSISFGKGIL